MSRRRNRTNQCMYMLGLDRHKRGKRNPSCGNSQGIKKTEEIIRHPYYKGISGGKQDGSNE